MNIICWFCLIFESWRSLVIPGSVVSDTLSLYVKCASCFPTESTRRIRASWRDWGPWSSCSVTCNYGKRTRQRECNRPKGHSHFCSQTENCSMGPCSGKNKMLFFFFTRNIVLTLHLFDVTFQLVKTNYIYFDSDTYPSPLHIIFSKHHSFGVRCLFSYIWIGIWIFSCFNVCFGFYQAFSPSRLSVVVLAF